MRRGYLFRRSDVSGVTGQGTVAALTEYPSGRVVMEWLDPPHGLTIQGSMADLLSIHGHQGQTEVRWVDKHPSRVKLVLGEEDAAG